MTAVITLALLGGCVPNDLFFTAEPYPTSVHEPGFWRDLSGLEGRSVVAREPPAPAAPTTVFITAAPSRLQPHDGEEPPAAAVPPKPSQRLSLGGLSRGIDTVMQDLDDLVEGSLAVQRSLLKLRLRPRRDQETVESDAEPEPADTERAGADDDSAGVE